VLAESLFASLASRYRIAHRNASLPEAKRLVAFDGVVLNYLDWGGTGTPIVFLHGGALTAHSWDLVCLGLRDDWQCIALDLRGHGDSGWSDSYSVETSVEDIATLCRHRGLARVHLVGNSLGGTIAAHFAATHPSLVASLTLVDVGPNIDFAATQRIRDYIERTDGTVDLQTAVEIGMQFNSQIDREALLYRLMYATRVGKDGHIYWKQDRRRMRDHDYFLGKVDEIARIAPTIHVPVLVARGGRSRVFSDEAAQACAAAFPHGRWVRIDDAGHNIQEANPAGLVAALNDFLRDVR
jgi:pimeloyl-ACP methyl ester carboxylesterase